MPSQLETTTHKHGGLRRLPQVKREALRRIRTVRGHIAGIEEMIEGERYCVEILKQIAAVQASLSQVAQLLTKGHMQTCLTEAIQSGQGDEKIEELMEVFKYLKAKITLDRIRKKADAHHGQARRVGVHLKHK